VAEAILWVRLAVAILIRRAFAVPDKGVPVDYALQRLLLSIDESYLVMKVIK
jgi:hypothetical protein